MYYWQAVVLGLIEGITEFLPISSTFHLIWAAKILQIPQSDFLKLFEVAIQGGAILAVLVVYFKKLSTKIFISFLPTAIVGFVLYKVIKNIFFENLILQLLVFVLMGVIFVAVERLNNKNNTKSISQISFKQAIIVGLCQSLAVVPGVSRAGAVMLTLFGMKVTRSEAAEYSFLLAVPTILAASFFDLIKSKDILLTQSSNLGLLIIGTLVSFLSALVVIKWLIKFLQNHTLEGFGWYRLILVAVLFQLFYH